MYTGTTMDHGQATLSSLEVEFLQGPFHHDGYTGTPGGTPVPIHPTIQHHLDVLFTTIDDDHNNNLDKQEFSILVQACTGASHTAALQTSQRFFASRFGTVQGHHKLSRHDFYVYFQSVFGALANEDAHISHSLHDLATEIHTIQHDAYAYCFNVVKTSAALLFLLSVVLCIVSTVSMPTMISIDQLFHSMDMGHGLFAHAFAQRSSYILAATGALGTMLGVGLLLSPSKRHQERMVLRCLSSTALLLSMAVLVLVSMVWVMTGNGETACTQECGSICSTAFSNVSHDASNDFDTCETLVRQGNCSCGFHILTGQAPEIQFIAITNTASLDDDVTLTFMGYTTSNISMGATNTTVAQALAVVTLGQNSTIGSEYGPVLVNANQDGTGVSWAITFQHCFFDADTMLVGTHDANSVVSTRMVQAGRERTSFGSVNNVFTSGIVDVVAVCGACFSVGFLFTGLIGSFVSCRNQACNAIRSKVHLGSVETWTEEQKGRVAEIHKRLRVSFRSGGCDGGDL